MMAFNVVRGTPRRVAALLAVSDASASISARGAGRLGPVERMTARSMKFRVHGRSLATTEPPEPSSCPAGILSICLFIFSAYFLVKCRTKYGYVTGMIAQRGCHDGKDLQPIVKIAAKQLLAHHLCQIVVGGRH